MIIIKLKGGLGNQLFQYGFGRLISNKRNEQLKLDISSLGSAKDTKRSFVLDKFNIKAEIASKEEIQKYAPSAFARFTKQKILREFHIGWQPQLLTSQKKYFEGYWQSYLYLDPIKDKLLQEITLKNPFTDYYKQISSQIKNSLSVAIHIRRGDFTDNQKIKSIHQTITLEYFQKAFSLIESKLQNNTYFVFSDDIAWVKTNLKTNSPTTYVSPDNASDEVQELILMSQCQHQIIANSTFSWWAAYLNQNLNKIVIAPKKWNNKYQKHYQHLLPKDWLSLNNFK